MNRYFKMLATILFFVAMTTSLMAQRNKDVDAALDDKSPLSKLYLGSYVGFGYSNGWQLDFSPGVGYRLTDWLIAGGGLNYSFGSQFDNFAQNDKITTTLIGPRAFAKFNVFQNYYAIADYSYNTFRVKYKDAQGNPQPIFVSYCEDNPNDPQCFNRNEHNMNLGAGYATQFGEGFGVYSEILIDVLFDRAHSPKPAPYSFRFGFFYTFR